MNKISADDTVMFINTRIENDKNTTPSIQNETVFGVFTIPKGQWFSFKRLIRNNYNSALSRDLSLALALHVKAKTLALQEETIYWNEFIDRIYIQHFKRHGLEFEVMSSSAMLKTMVNTKLNTLLLPKKCNLPFAPVKTAHFAHPAFDLILDESKHQLRYIAKPIDLNTLALDAWELAHTSGLGKAASKALSHIQWTRRTGGYVEKRSLDGSITTVTLP